jgi:hypothetical protein
MVCVRIDGGAGIKLSLTALEFSALSSLMVRASRGSNRLD